LITSFPNQTSTLKYSKVFSFQLQALGRRGGASSPITDDVLFGLKEIEEDCRGWEGLNLQQVETPPQSLGKRINRTRA